MFLKIALKGTKIDQFLVDIFEKIQSLLTESVYIFRSVFCIFVTLNFTLAEQDRFFIVILYN